MECFTNCTGIIIRILFLFNPDHHLIFGNIVLFFIQNQTLRYFFPGLNLTTCSRDNFTEIEEEKPREVSKIFFFLFHDLSVLFQPLFLNYIKHISSTFAKPALSRTFFLDNMISLFSLLIIVEVK